MIADFWISRFQSSIPKILEAASGFLTCFGGCRNFIRFRILYKIYRSIFGQQIHAQFPCVTPGLPHPQRKAPSLNLDDRLLLSGSVATSALSLRSWQAERWCNSFLTFLHRLSIIIYWIFPLILPLWDDFVSVRENGASRRKEQTRKKRLKIQGSWVKG